MHPLLDLSRRPIVGHRGNRAHAPENTLESFRQAVSLGADALELDVHLTVDREVVIVHDATVDRTTDGTGAVASMSLADIRSLDAGSRFTSDGGRSFPYRGHGVGIPTLDELLESLPETSLVVEIKTPAASEGVQRIIERHGAETRVIVDAFDDRALAIFRGGKIPIGSTTNDVARLYLPSLLGRTFASLPFHAMCVPRTYRGLPLPLGAMARAVAPAGVPLHVWTVNDPAIARRLWASGVRGIITDDPAVMLGARGED